MEDRGHGLGLLAKDREGRNSSSGRINGGEDKIGAKGRKDLSHMSHTENILCLRFWNEECI